MQLTPFSILLRALLDQLQAKDQARIFTQPVDVTEVICSRYANTFYPSVIAFVRTKTSAFRCYKNVRWDDMAPKFVAKILAKLFVCCYVFVLCHTVILLIILCRLLKLWPFLSLWLFFVPSPLLCIH